MAKQADGRVEADAKFKELLDNHLIFEKLFGYLQFPDLFGASLVSADMYQRTRRYMLRKRICLVRLFFEETCLKLKHFNDFLAVSPSSVILPYNGIQFHSSNLHFQNCWNHRSHQEFFRSRRLQTYCFSRFPMLFSKLRLKHVEIFPTSGRCPIVAQCIDELSKTTKNMESLESIEIQLHYPCQIPRMITKLEWLGAQMKTRKVPPLLNLRTLRLKWATFDGYELQIEILKFLRDFAPSLREIRGHLHEDVYMSAIPLRHNYKLRVQYFPGQMSSSSVQRLIKDSAQLETFCLCTETWGRVGTLDWDPAYGTLLRNSSSTLMGLSITMSQLQLFSTQNFPSFSNLESLRLSSGTELPQESFVFLPFLDWSGMFPALRELRLIPGSSQESFTTLRSLLVPPVVHPFSSLSSLIVETGEYDCYEQQNLGRLSLESFQAMMTAFPAVRDLSINRALLTVLYLAAPRPLAWKLDTLNLVLKTLTLNLWEDIFSCLQNGLQNLHLRIHDNVLYGNRENWRREDGFLIPFITPDLAQRVKKLHPELIINIMAFFPIAPTVQTLAHIVEVVQPSESRYLLKFNTL